jgi:AcrR family transcriptional regulator
MNSPQTPDLSTTGALTRARLIEVAAKHFADEGYAAASQRAIQREAGVNPASAHYHFGSKEAMFRAVVDAFIHDIQQERIRRHDAIPAKIVGHERLQRLLTAYFAPGLAVAATPQGYHYARILARVQGERRGQSLEIFEEIVLPVREMFVDSLHRLYPAKPRDEVYELLMTGVTIMAIGAIGSRHDKLLQPGGVEAEADRMATIVAAGFEALLGPPDHQS